MNTKQSVVARPESADGNPTIKTLSRYAEALGGHLEISIGRCVPSNYWTPESKAFSFSHYFMQRGGNIKEWQDVMGHATLALTERCLKFAPMHPESAQMLNPVTTDEADISMSLKNNAENNL